MEALPVSSWYAACETGCEPVSPVSKSRSHLDGEQASADEETEQQYTEGREVTSIWTPVCWEKIGCRGTVAPCLNALGQSQFGHRETRFLPTVFYWH